jgi:transposase-like protein
MRAPRPGRDYPRTQREFYTMFPTDEACVSWLAHLRWGAGFVCPECGCPEFLLAPDGYRCRSLSCRRRVPVLSGTPLHRARVSLPALLEAAWLLTEPGGVNSVRYQDHAPMNRENAWTILHKFREVMHAEMVANQLRGVVEVDEVFVGGKPRRRGSGRRGGGTTQQLVVVLIERRKGGRVCFKAASSASARVLLPIVKRTISPTSTIRTDGNPSYSGLEALGYRHTVFNMSALPNPAHYYLPAVHSVAAHMKGWMLTVYRRTPSRKHFDYYMAEYAFRFNHRTARQRGLLFYRLMEAAVAYGEVTQRAIIAR